MVISYLGGECFKVSQGDLTLAFNPPSKNSSLKSSKFGSDIVLVSQDHADFNGVENCSFGDREPFVIDGPGEYEVKGVAVRGYGSLGLDGGLNTIYSISLEGMHLCFLGALSSAALSPAAKQDLDDIDLLFVPVDTLGQSEAYKLAVALEPKAIIPMQYSAVSLKAFLKEAGADETKPLEKLTVKKKDLQDKEVEVIVLEA